MSSVFLAVIVGGAFGFALDRVGASNPGYIINMQRLTNLHLMKTILLGIGVASLLVFGSLLIGLVDPAHLSVKAAYGGVFIGGLLLGTGFAMSGYCPGTGIAALATGRKDALFFVLGGLAGAGAYMVSFSAVDSTGLLDDILGGKTTLGAIADTGYNALISGLSGEVIGMIMGVAFIAVAAALPARLRRAQ